MEFTCKNCRSMMPWAGQIKAGEYGGYVLYLTCPRCKQDQTVVSSPHREPLQEILNNQEGS